MISSLDAARTPLERGITLVEASAGTGKTYAIAMLVLRAVCEQEIPIEKILVVTFTRAATEELRGRIRQRLAEARRLLAGKQQPEDATMAAWLETIDDNVRPQMEKLVTRALYDIDQAAIFTIHSFCQRMLVEQALESGQLFDVEMQGDSDDIRRQVAEDFWRATVYPMDREACGIIVAEYPSPGELLKVMGRAGEYHCLEPQSPGVAHWAKKFSAAVDSLRRWFLGDGGGKTLQAFCVAHDAKHFKKPLADEENFRDFLGQVSDYLLEKTEQPPLKYLAFLHKEGLLEIINKKKFKTDAQRVQFLERFSLPDEEMGDFIAARKQLLIAFRRDFLLFLEETLQKTLEERGLLSFDGLIRVLDRALSDENSTLRTLLAQRYDAACIDEFQDTDFRQWHIFSSLFAGG
ncbi:exodeoxyribonuclease V subunit beta, partial [candidate division KSB3 bacterium]